jgi:hypothetical protein
VQARGRGPLHSNGNGVRRCAHDGDHNRHCGPFRQPWRNERIYLITTGEGPAHVLELTRANVIELNEAFFAIKTNPEKTALPKITITVRAANSPRAAPERRAGGSVGARYHAPNRASERANAQTLHPRGQPVQG